MRDPVPVQKRREAFYLLLLNHLVHTLPGTQFCLKADCNLRFFFLSDRYPDILSCDVIAPDIDAFSAFLKSIITCEPLARDLADRGMRIGPCRQATSTDNQELTFNVSLCPQNGSAIIEAKMVMYLLSSIEGAALENVREQVLKSYGLTPFMLPHYSKDSEFSSKVRSLTVRDSSLTKNIYDLMVLHRGGAHTLPGFALTPEEVNAARENTLSLSYHHFEKEVLPDLTYGPGTERNAKDTWNGLASIVVDILSRFGGG